MIRSFRHKGLRLFFLNGDRRRIPAEKAPRLARMLDRLNASECPGDMNLPGYRWHPLKGELGGRYACNVSGNDRLTFGFDGKDAIDVDLEDYH